MDADIFRFQVGTFSCVAVLDGTFQYPPSLFFANVPPDVYQPRLREDGQSATAMEVPYICLYIDTGDHRVLVDTGAAGIGPTTGKLSERLHSADIDPDRIGTVVLSHGHPDHIGGNLNERGVSAFPNAEYVMFRKEWDYWMSEPSLDELSAEAWLKEIILTSARKNLPSIEPQLRLLEREGEIVRGVTAIAAPGHTRGHMALSIGLGSDQLLFIADAALHPLHVERPEITAQVDHQPDEMVTTRRTLIARAADGKTIVLASHFPFPGLGCVSRHDDGWRWRPI
jgi:glyoxylase-like metal-dependent hydrolase (beta-lactamase superfamily II)